MKVQNIGLALGLAFLGVLQQVSSAKALEYKIEWSGVSLGNTAVATGIIDFDPSVVAPGGTTLILPTNFSMTVTGASGGNGTFDKTNFSHFQFTIPGTQNLDFSKELVGQILVGTPDPFGTSYAGNAGDFQLFRKPASPNAPYGGSAFTIVTAAGNNDNLRMTSFAPVATAVPFDFNPAEGAALGVPLFVGLGILRKRVARKLAASKAAVGVE